MTFENEAWATETLPDYLGEADEEFPPGDLDPGKSVIIGDLGHDLPVALDYRANPADPRVVFLSTRVAGRWITVAASIADLIEALGLSSQNRER